MREKDWWRLLKHRFRHQLRASSPDLRDPWWISVKAENGNWWKKVRLCKQASYSPRCPFQIACSSKLKWDSAKKEIKVKLVFEGSMRQLTNKNDRLMSSVSMSRISSMSTSTASFWNWHAKGYEKAREISKIKSWGVCQLRHCGSLIEFFACLFRTQV